MRELNASDELAVVDQAIEFLEHRGWCKNSPARSRNGATASASDPTAPRRCLTSCLSFAFHVVTNSTIQIALAIRWDTHPLGQKLRQFIVDDSRAGHIPVGGTLVGWNDRQRKKSVVINTLKRFRHHLAETHKEPATA